MRKIILYSTKGGKKEIASDAQTWGELKEKVEELYDLENLQATENINKTTLVNNDAVLPEKNFIIFLRPIETKGGNHPFDVLSEMSFLELRKIVKQECYEGIKDFLNQFKKNKNYTQLNKEELREGVILYFAEDKATKKKVSFKYEIDKLDEMLDFFVDIYDNINKPLNKSSKEIIEVIQSDISELTAILYNLESVGVEKKDDELEKLEKEYKEIEKGFSDS